MMKSMIVFVIFSIIGMISAAPGKGKGKMKGINNLDELEVGVMTVEYLHVHGDGNIHVKTGDIHVENGNVMVGGDIMIGGKSLKEFMSQFD